MKKPILTLSAKKASMVLSEACVSWCPLCEILGHKGCDNITGTRRRIFQRAFVPSGGGMNVDRLASYISVKK